MGQLFRLQTAFSISFVVLGPRLGQPPLGLASWLAAKLCLQGALERGRKAAGGGVTPFSQGPSVPESLLLTKLLHSCCRLLAGIKSSLQFRQHPQDQLHLAPFRKQHQQRSEGFNVPPLPLLNFNNSDLFLCAPGPEGDSFLRWAVSNQGCVWPSGDI